MGISNEISMPIAGSSNAIAIEAFKYQPHQSSYGNKGQSTEQKDFDFLPTTQS